jgi:hypothetical protein
MPCCRINKSDDAREKCCDLFATTMLLALLSGGLFLAGCLKKKGNPDYVSVFEISPVLAYTTSAVLILMVGVMAVRSVAQTGIIGCGPDDSSYSDTDARRRARPR